MKKLQLLFFLVFPFLMVCQTNVNQSLYVSHVESSSKGAFKQRIFAYRFLNGSYTGRDEVISFDGKQGGKDYIRTDRGVNTIYKERYLITGLGNIVDLKEKKVLFDGKASLIRCSNDSAIFYTNDIFKGKFYSVYDFKNNEYREVKNLLFNPKFGRDVEFDKSAKPFKLNYYPQGKPKITLLENAGYGQHATKGNSFVPDPPLYWIDNDNFLYLSFNEENTEFAIYVVNVDSKKTTLIGKQAMNKDRSEAFLTKNSKDILILKIGNKQYLIDYKQSTITAMEASYPDKGFSFEFKSDQKGRVIKLNDKEIGKYNFETINFKAGDNIAAFVKELRIGPETYQQGLMVWNTVKQKWAGVDADEVLAIIGWTND